MHASFFMIHSNSYHASAFLLLGIVHSNSQWLAPLFFLGCLSGIRENEPVKGMYLNVSFTGLLRVLNDDELLKAAFLNASAFYSVECKTCQWTPRTIYASEPLAHLQLDIHRKVRGHRHYLGHTLYQYDLESV